MPSQYKTDVLNAVADLDACVKAVNSRTKELANRIVVTPKDTNALRVIIGELDDESDKLVQGFHDLYAVADRTEPQSEDYSDLLRTITAATAELQG